MKSIDEYADFTDVVWKNPVDGNDPTTICALGLVGEAGEVVEKVKKWQHYGKVWDNKDMVKELGDVVFYWVRLCRHCGYEPSEVLQANVEKLTTRAEKGTIWGEGSDR